VVQGRRERKRGLQVMVWAVLLAAVGVSMAGLTQSPTYEASAHVLVGWQQEGRLETLELREQLIQTIAPAIDNRPVAEESIQRLELEMAPAELLDNLDIQQVEGTRFIRLSYTDTDPVRAQRIINTVGEVFSEFISERSTFTAKVYEEALVPDSPVSPSPLRNGLLTLVMGWGLIGLLVLIHPSA
jgi:capsular polysaccharide biosynthesis protein